MNKGNFFMAITTQRRIYELSTCGKTDGSIEKEFDNAKLAYDKVKDKYKISKFKYAEAQKVY